MIGDTANVEDGQIYGKASDIIIGTDGKVAAVLVDRGSNWGGGTYGYPYASGYGYDWEPTGNSYPLPFDSVDLAASVPQIDKSRIDDQSQ